MDSEVKVLITVAWVALGLVALVLGVGLFMGIIASWVAICAMVLLAVYGALVPVFTYVGVKGWINEP